MRFRHRTVLPMAAGLVLAITVGAAGYAASTQSVQNSNVDVVRTRTSQKNLPVAGATNTTVISVVLPSGSWVVTANATVVHFGSNDYVRCGIYRDGTLLNVATTMIGAGAGVVGGINPIASFKSGGPHTVSLRCSHDTSAGGLYVDPGAVLWAHRSASLNRT
jgi:hypothetical protein